LFFIDRTVLEANSASGWRSDGVIVLSGAEGRHAAVVRRLRAGERIDVGDGAGQVASCVVTRVLDGGGLELAVQARREVPRSRPLITVIQAIPKGDRGELAVEEMTEVGVDRIIPWAAERSVPVWRNGRGAGRWRAKAREAAKQAERAWIPEVTDAVTTAEAAQLISVGGLTVGGLAVVLEPGAADPLAAIIPPADGELVVVIGPEGGITAAESAAFVAAGAKPYRLGPSILRTSTAGAVAAAVLLSRTSRWA
jgi:16S rRNA (uracil1498-N3)-methyltransferase